MIIKIFFNQIIFIDYHFICVNYHQLMINHNIHYINLIIHFLFRYFFLLLTVSCPFHLTNKSVFLLNKSSSYLVHSTHESPLNDRSKSGKFPDTLFNFFKRVGKVVWYSFANNLNISSIYSVVYGSLLTKGDFYIKIIIVLVLKIIIILFKIVKK